MSTNPVTITPDAAPQPAAPPPAPVWIGSLVGVVAAFVGLLPWLATGMRLPLQNLWAGEVDVSGMPMVMLPFSQYSLTLLFGLIVTGSALAGIVARALRPRLPRGGYLLLVCGVLAIQVISTAQTAATVAPRLQERTESTLYLTALVAVCVLSVLIGLGALALVARAPRAGALIGLTIGALAIGPWLMGWLRPFQVTDGQLVMNLGSAMQWAPGILVGVAIAWAGIGSVGRVVATITSLAMLWIIPAAMTGVSSAAGTRVLANHPGEMISYALEVFRMALFIPELALRPVIVAVVVAAVGLGVRWFLSRRAVQTPAAPPLSG